MKRILFIFCFAYIATNVVAAQSITIDERGIRVDGWSDCDATNNNRYKSTRNKTFFSGIGFIVPNNGAGDNYFTTIAGNSINLDFGMMHKNHVSNRFAFGRTIQYSYYNYRSWNMAHHPAIIENVIQKDYDKHGIRKQAFRSHNLAVSGFARLYLTSNRNGLFVDLGAQGDFSYSKFFKIKTETQGKNKYRNDYAFNPFNASAIARVGWDKKNCWLKIDGNCCWNSRKSRALFVRYRFTDAFYSRVLPMDLPPVTVGVQFF